MMDSGRMCDVAVIGAGPAGRAAASAAAKAGARVALIDERAIDPANLPEGVEAMAATQAWGLFRDGEVGLIRSGEANVLRARAVIVATGARDMLAPFPGWTQAGVFARDEACRLIAQGAFPHKRVTVISDEPTPDLDTLLTGAGCAVVARLTSVTFPSFAATGDGAIESCSLEGRSQACDAVIMTVGRQPDDALTRMAGTVAIWRPEQGGNVPLRDTLLRVNGSWCWVTGDAAGLLGDPALGREEATLVGECAARVALNESTGEIAGRIASFTAAHPDRLPARAAPRADDPLSAWLRGVRDETVICRCEGIDGRRIREAITAGMRSINDVKRRTRAGMGSCQGAWCTRPIGVMLADAGVPELDPSPMTSRPPARLVTIGQLARLTDA